MKPRPVSANVWVSHFAQTDTKKKTTENEEPMAIACFAIPPSCKLMFPK